MRLRAASGLAALAAMAGGCGAAARTATAPRTVTSEVSVRTASGLRYSDALTIRAGRACQVQTFAVLARRVPRSEKTTRSCGRAAGLALIQFAHPPAAFVLDRPAGSCGTVQIATPAGRTLVAHPVCSATRPVLRLTPLPRARTLEIGGIAGLTRLTLADYRCRDICSRPLPTSATDPR